MEHEIPLSELVKMTYEQIHEKDSCDLFYDWFAKNSSLPGKSKRLMSTVRAIVATKTKLFDPAKTYVFFKNNCPIAAPLYDDLRICDLESGKVLFNVCPHNPHFDGFATVSFDAEDKDRWETPLVFDEMKNVKAWFKDPDAFEAKTESVRVACARYQKMDMCRRKAA